MIMANSVLEDVPSPKETVRKSTRKFLRLFFGGCFFLKTGGKNPAYNVG